MIRDELRRLASWEERHRRLVARIALALGLTLVVDLAGSLGMWALERGARGSDIHHFGDALFFTTVQLLTVSSQLRNPVTTCGRIIDVLLELWAIVVVTSLAGSFAAFFSSVDRPMPATRDA